MRNKGPLIKYFPYFVAIKMNLSSVFKTLLKNKTLKTKFSANISLSAEPVQSKHHVWTSTCECSSVTPSLGWRIWQLLQIILTLKTLYSKLVFWRLIRVIIQQAPHYLSYQDRALHFYSWEYHFTMRQAFELEFLPLTYHVCDYGQMTLCELVCTLVI